MRITQGAGACAVLAIAIAACGSASSSTDSPSQLLTQGVQALTALHSEQVTGTFTIDGTNGSILASVLQDGDASGTLNLGDSDSPFVSSGGATYWETLATFVSSTFPTEIATLAQLIKGQPWWHTAGSTEAVAVLQLLSPAGLRSAFLAGLSGLKATQGKDSSGRAATVLSNASGTVYVATSSPHNILEIKTAPHYLAGRFSAVDFTFNQFNAPVNLTVPTNALIPDVTHLPGYFFMKSVDLNNCNNSGCKATGVVEAEAGSGKAVVTFTVTDDAGKKLAGCTATVDVANYTATPGVTCHADGGPWAHWWDTSDGGTYTLVGTVANADYTS